DDLPFAIHRIEITGRLYRSDDMGQVGDGAHAGARPGVDGVLAGAGIEAGAVFHNGGHIVEGDQLVVLSLRAGGLGDGIRGGDVEAELEFFGDGGFEIGAGAVVGVACVEQDAVLVEIVTGGEVADGLGPTAGGDFVVLEGSGTEGGILPVDVLDAG